MRRLGARLQTDPEVGAAVRIGHRRVVRRAVVVRRAAVGPAGPPVVLGLGLAVVGVVRRIVGRRRTVVTRGGFSTTAIPIHRAKPILPSSTSN